MSIDIHISNYEEFLYSYVDGELDAAAVAALEAFMEAHPHIRQELELLMATRLAPAEMVFDNKASLYRSNTISLQNYEPFLINYVDGELNREDAAAVEQFAAAHPAVQKELNTWMATRLQPDTSIRFDNKAALYRRTAKVRTLRPAYWWGAAAAVVAGALFFILPGKQPAAPPAVAVVTQPAPAAPQIIAPAEEAAADKATEPAVTTTPEKAAPPAPLANAQPRTPATQEAHRPSPAPARTAATQPAAPPVQPPSAPLVAEATPADMPKSRPVDIARVEIEKPAAKAPEAIQAELNKQPENQTIVAKRQPPTSLEAQPEAALATAAPAANPPGELIMSVTGNGLESKVLDKVTNVARLFSRKRNK